MNRRNELLMGTLLFAAAGFGWAANLPAQVNEKRAFHVWAVSCAHVPADIRRGRESLARAIRQSEGREPNSPAFDWDIMLDAGDLSAHQYPPGDRDGQELLRQYRALKDHRREQIYNVPGNHDSPYYDHGPGSWFRKWGDPLGRHSEFSGVDAARRPFAVQGTWERYSFTAGNMLFLMLADRNDAPTPVGRGHSKQALRGGYPPGAVTRATFDWWKDKVLQNQDKIIVTMHHHALRDTTTASGKGEGHPRYHGNTGGGEGSSYLYFLIENDDPDDFRYTADAHVFEDFLDKYHQEHGRGAIDLWIAGHTHVKGPDDDWGGKTITENRWGVSFLQVAALTQHHGGSIPLSRVLRFEDGARHVQAQVYLHEANFNDHPIGFHAPSARRLQLRHAVKAPAPIKKMPPFPKQAKRFTSRYAPAPVPEVATLLAKSSPSLVDNWNSQQGGSLEIESSLRSDRSHEIDRKPRLVALQHPKGRFAAEFNGANRLRIGAIDMQQWASLTLSAWVKASEKARNMRVVSKDRIGEPGNVVLLQSAPDAWTMRAWDPQASCWQSATWRAAPDADTGWLHLTGVVDGPGREVRLFVNGRLKAKAPWTAMNLDDSDKADLVIGADSGEKKFGHGFRGQIHDVHLYPRALSAGEVRALPGTRPK